MSRVGIVVVCLALLAGTASAQNLAMQQAMMERAFSAQAEASAKLIAPGALRALVCGSASPLGIDPKRQQACIAVIAGGRIFVVDAGAGSARSLARAGLPLDRLEAVLLTHFHSDHIGALGDINLAGWVAGRTGPLRVMGPEGVEQVVAGFNDAYALDRTYRTAHHGAEMFPPAAGVMEARTVAEGTIYEQDGVRITAFPVDHHPVEPAFGYRFDFGGRSVVISGDTVESKSLTKAARGADLLFHDAMADGFMKTLGQVRKKTGPERMAKLIEDVQSYHATTADVAATATEAGVRMTVLYHLVPAPANPMVLSSFAQGLPEGIVVGADGMLFELAEQATSVEQSQVFDP
jgi:ribonuclease Z